jgi:hypothetical protein
MGAVHLGTGMHATDRVFEGRGETPERQIPASSHYDLITGGLTFRNHYYLMAERLTFCNSYGGKIQGIQNKKLQIEYGARA